MCIRDSSILAFLEGSCGLTVASTNQRAHVTLADSPVSDILEIPSGTPLLQMKGVAYDGRNRPLYMLNDYLDVYKRQFWEPLLFSPSTI